MNRRLGALLSLLACLHMLALASPARADWRNPGVRLAQAQKPKPATDLIQKGQAQFDDQQYEESIQTLSAALLRPTNTKEQKVEIFRLLALNYITLNRKDEAESAVRGLLVQQPDYQLPATESPRFRDFFKNVRGKWEADGRPGLVQAQEPEPVQAVKQVTLKHSTPMQQAEPGKSIELRGRLDDPDGRAGSVKLYYRVGTKGDFTMVLATVEGTVVRAQIPGDSVKPPVIEYYFEVLDGAGELIADRGDAAVALRIAVPEQSKGWVLPLAIGGGVLGAAAIIGGLALAGVFGSSAEPPPPGRPMSTVSVSIGETSR